MPGNKQEDFQRNNAFLLYDLYSQAQENTTPGVNKYIILVDPSLVIITIYSVCLNHAPE